MATCTGRDQTLVVPVLAAAGGHTFAKGTAYATAVGDERLPSGFCDFVGATPTYVRLAK